MVKRKSDRSHFVVGKKSGGNREKGQGEAEWVGEGEVGGEAREKILGANNLPKQELWTKRGIAV